MVAELCLPSASWCHAGVTFIQTDVSAETWIGRTSGRRDLVNEWKMMAYANELVYLVNEWKMMAHANELVDLL